MTPLRLSRTQTGMVMVVALLMLVLMLVVVVSSFNLGRHNTMIAGNVQNRAQTFNLANRVLEEVISQTAFIDTPATPLAGRSSVSFDLNGDSTNDVLVSFYPQPCLKKVRVIKNSELDLSRASDQTCMLGQQQTLGVEGSAGTSNESLCANTLWEITAGASDAVTGAAATTVAGVNVRTATDSALDTSKVCL